MINRYLSIILLSSLIITNVFTSLAQSCDSQDAEAWRSQANNDYGLDNYEEAITGYTCLIEVSDSDEEVAFAYTWRGVSKQILGQLDEAKNDMNQAISVDPTRGHSYYSRGNLYLDFDEYDLAIEDFTTAILNDYRRAWVYNDRGYAYYQTDNISKAKTDYINAINVEREYGLAYSNLGSIYFEEGNLNDALDNYELGIENSEGLTRSYAYHNRALIRYIDQDYIGAIDDYTLATEADPDNGSAYLSRAKVYQAIQSPNAYADYLRYIQSIQTEIVEIEQPYVTQSLDLIEGRVYRVAVALRAGDLLSVSANAVPDEDVDPLILVLGLSGNPIMADDDGGMNKDAVINRFPIAEGGIYTLLITHSDTEGNGEIQFTAGTTSRSTAELIPYQLRIGELAEIFAISNDGPGIVNLRSFPSLGFEVLDELSRGAQVTILNGPYKDEDFVWWQAQTTDGQVGWVAEHINGVQILAPAIYVGRTVTVNVSELNFRTEPSVNSELVHSLYREAKALLPVIDGPIEADGFTWWKVRINAEVEGWAVERVEDNQTLVVILDTP